MNCPVCKSDDYIRFVFVDRHVSIQNAKAANDSQITTENPSDNHFVYMCEDLHFFGEDEKEIVRDVARTSLIKK